MTVFSSSSSFQGEGIQMRCCVRDVFCSLYAERCFRLETISERYLFFKKKTVLHQGLNHTNLFILLTLTANISLSLYSILPVKTLALSPRLTMMKETVLCHTQTKTFYTAHLYRKYQVRLKLI